METISSGEISFGWNFEKNRQKLPIFPDIFGQSTRVKGQSTRAWGGQCGRAIVKLKNAFDFCSEGDLNPKQKA